MRKHRLGKQLLIVLCVVLIVFLAGCRPSPVLEQIIYEQNHEVNEDIETQSIDNDQENEEQDENIPPRETVDDSEQTKDQEYTAALAGDTDTDSEDPDAVYSVTYAQYGELSEPDEANPTEGSASEKATGSTKAGGDEGGYAPSGEGEEPGNDGMSADESDGGTEAGTEQTGGENGDNPDIDLESGDGPQSSEEPPESPPINEPDTEPEDLPTGTRVTAVGEAATIVEMLGGQLVGTSSSFMENQLAQQIFASQRVSEAQTWWDGDGSSVISDGNFQALLEANPEVCIWISEENTFSTEQIAALDAAEIAYVVLPKLNSIDNIEEAVLDVGQVLGDDAQSKAKSYCDWAENMVSLAGGGSTKYTAYIGDWDVGATWQVTSTSGLFWWGTGAPVGVRNTGVLNECMGLANVSNRASDGNYVEPLKANYYVPSIEGPLAVYTPEKKNVFSSSWRLGVATGTYPFPAVIAANDSIKSALETEPYFSEHWRVGENLPLGTGNNAHGFGFYDGTDSGQIVTTYIEGDYDILVNPSGVGSWAGGSVESPLEAVWLTCMFQDNISMSELQGLVRDFYKDFYDADVDVSAIFPEGSHVTR